MKLTRRALIGTTTATLLSRQSTGTTNTLDLRPKGEDLLVLVNDEIQWIVVAARFGARAKLVISAPNVISISNAVFPSGTVFNLIFYFLYQNGKWTCSIIWKIGENAKGLRSIALTLHSLRNGQFIKTSIPNAVVRDILGTSLSAQQIPRRASLNLDLNQNIEIFASDKSFEILDGNVSFRHLRLIPLPIDAPARASALVLDKSIIRNISLGHTSSAEVHLRLTGRVSTTYIRQSSEPVITNGSFVVEVLGHSESDPPIEVSKVCLGSDIRTHVAKLTLREGLWPYATRLGKFCLSAEDPGSPGKYVDATIRFKGGVITAFDFPLHLHSHNLSVEGADRTRLDFNAAPFPLHLAGLNSLKNQVGYVLGSSKPPARINLKYATLRVMRGRDLMSLKFRFDGFDLEINGRTPKLVATRNASIDPDVPGPLLAVHFPPQHLMEQAFLRQDINLPDAGDPLTPSQLRMLASPDMSTVGLLRQQISSSKIEAEAMELQPGDPHPFREFSDAWNADTTLVPQVEKPWLGPNALLTIKSRQIARIFSAQQRTARIDSVIAIFRDQAADTHLLQAAVTETIGLVPFPDLALTRSELVGIVPRQTIDLNDLARAVLTEASKRDSDIADLRAAWQSLRADGSLADPLVFQDWPLSPVDWKELISESGSSFGGKVPTPLPIDELLKSFLISRLELRKKIDAIDLDPLHPEQTPEGFARPVEARLSGPSRLVFECGRRMPQVLTVDALTAWDGFELRVVRRAYRSYKKDVPPKAMPEQETDLGAILKFQGIRRTVSSVDRMASIYESLSRGPGEFETALEVPSRLILSPAQDAIWLTPVRGSPKIAFWHPSSSDPMMIWQARLQEALPTPSLRAVWSPDFNPSVFHFRPEKQSIPNPPPGPWAPWNTDNSKIVKFRTGLDSADRHELVAQTSCHGLPVIGVGSFQIDSGREESSLVAAPEGYALDDLDPLYGDSGVYIPQTITTRRLALSSLGATLDVDARFRPPNAARYKPDAKSPSPGTALYDEFSVQHWRTSLIDSEDVITTIVRQGYLFPLGHSASLVRITEPHIRLAMSTNLSSGYVIEQQQRYFIEVTEPKHIYPATGQPNRGLGFPAREINLQTLRTPDLIDPTEERPRQWGDLTGALRTTVRGNVQGTVTSKPNGDLRPLSGLIFWPRTTAGSIGTVRFRMVVDDSSVPMSLPLLFIDQRGASDPATIEALCTRYYTPLPSATSEQTRELPKQHNILHHNSAQRAYADERKKGECSFITDWQELAATGHAGADLSSFVFDSALQSAGQPPFYPTMRQAQIRSQQIQNLTGRNGDPILVVYNQRFLNEGFTEALDGQVFLDTVLAPTLDMGSNGDRSGGIGRPALHVAQFDRTFGPVGNSQISKSGSPAPVQPKSRDQVAVATTSPPDFAKNFFDSSAKLLGLIDLNFFVSLITENIEGSLPRLTEALEYNIDQGAIASLTSVVSLILDTVRKQLAALGARSIYKSLTDAMDELQTAIDTLRTNHEIDAQAPTLAAIWSSGRRLAQVFDEISRAPIGPAVEHLREILSSVGPDLKAILTAKNPGKSLRDAMSEAIAAGVSTPNAWADCVVQVPITDVGDREEAVAIVRRAAGIPANWLMSSPLTAIAESINSDPNFIKLQQTSQERLTAAALRGPLFSDIDAILGPLNAGVESGLQNGAAALANGLETAFQVAQQFAKLAALADSICQSGLSILNDFMDMVFPDLGVCQTTGVGAAVRAGLQSLVGSEPPGAVTCGAAKVSATGFRSIASSLSDIATGNPNQATAIAPYVSFADGMATTLETTAAAIDSTLIKLSSARAKVVNSISGMSSCNSFPGDFNANLGELISERAVLIALYTRAGLTTSLPLPASPVPPMIDTLWLQTANAISSVAQLLLRSALGATLSGSFSGSRQSGAARVKIILDDTATKIGSDATLLDNNLGSLFAAAEQVSATLDTLTQSSNQSAAEAWSAAQQAQQVVAELLGEKTTIVEDEVTRAVLRITLSAEIPSSIGNLARTFINSAGAPISEIYQSLLQSRNAAYLEAMSGDELAKSLFGVPTGAGVCGTGWAASVLLLPIAGQPSCDENTDLFAQEADDASKAKTDFTILKSIVGKWVSGEAAPLQIMRHGQSLADATIRSALLRVLDVDGLKNQLQDQIKSLLPFRKRISNELNLRLQPLMIADVVTFKPSGLQQLTLQSNIDVLLDQAKVTASYSGKISPFILDVSEVITINFSEGIAYSGGTGQVGKLTAHLTDEDVTFGSLLYFLGELASWLTVGGGNGPFTQITLLNPAIEAGYRISIPVIFLGVTFTNINFFGSILLPFDDKQARLRVSLGSVDSPFLISAGIYGGGGYLALEASARGIEAFESSFEFGGVGSIGFGPLQGTAYILSGVYVRKDQGGATLSALFNAGFTAHVACFAISAAFTLRLGTVAGGALEGTATLTFTFSVGFAKFSYSVSVARRMGKGFKDGGSDAGDQQASIQSQTPYELAGPWTGQSYCAKISPAKLLTGGTSAGDHWGKYSACFDQTFRPEQI